MARDWDQRGTELAAESIARGQPSGWFERLYAEGAAGAVAMPWNRTAIEIARSRHLDSTVDYRVADLLALPADLISGFDLVVEVFTLQALPEPPRSAAGVAVGSLVSPGGTLLVIALRHDGTRPADHGPPFPLTREAMINLAAGGLSLVALEQLDGPRWRARYRRSD